VSGEERPPFMTVFNFHPSTSVKCSSSIISEFWIISAAHCIVSKSHIMDGSCLTNYAKAKFKTVCEKQKNGDMKLMFPEQEESTPEVFIDVDNLSEDFRDKSKKYLVDFIISHKDGYKGGMYGAYGGYDVILVKLRKPVSKDVRACLPGPSHEISSPMIGGYGRYRRVPCEVSDLGPEVFQYCKVQPECLRDSKIYKDAKCAVLFDHKGKEHKGCIKDHDTPSASDPECNSFRQKTDITDKSMQRDEINEFVIVDSKQKLISKCYRTSPGQYGWCGVTKHTINGKTISDRPDLEVENVEGWGVCSDTCEDTENAHITGTARLKPVEIIDQAYCDEKLNTIRQGKEPFEVPPQVYCVAYNETYKTKFYQKSESGDYKELSDEEGAPLHMSLLGREHSWYIRATGSCKGDSGGPLYEEKDDQYILLGSTSRGTGGLANCGGIDNPTHYVRMKDLLPWIKSYVGEENLCIVN